jgi:hypothetical protein
LVSGPAARGSVSTTKQAVVVELPADIDHRGPACGGNLIRPRRTFDLLGHVQKHPHTACADGVADADRTPGRIALPRDFLDIDAAFAEYDIPPEDIDAMPKRFADWRRELLAVS